MRSTKFFAVIAFTFGFIGCGGSTSPVAVAPVGGFNQSHVSYDTDPIESAKEPLVVTSEQKLTDDPFRAVSVPTISVSDRGAKVAEVSLTAKPNDELIIEGTFTVPTPVKCGVMVIVDLVEVHKVNDANGPRQIRHVVRHVDTLAMKGDVPNGKLDYKAIVKAPETKGEYQIEVRFMHPQTANEMFLGATGVAKIE